MVGALENSRIEKFAHQQLRDAGLSVVCALARSTW
jgi:hypothetical protein